MNTLRWRWLDPPIKDEPLRTYENSPFCIPCTGRCCYFSTFSLFLTPPLSLSLSFFFRRGHVRPLRSGAGANERSTVIEQDIAQKVHFLVFGILCGTGRLHFEFFVFAHFDRMQFDHWESRANHKSSNECASPSHSVFQCVTGWFERFSEGRFFPFHSQDFLCASKRGAANWETPRHSQ